MTVDQDRVRKTLAEMMRVYLMCADLDEAYPHEYIAEEFLESGWLQDYTSRVAEATLRDAAEAWDSEGEMPRLNELAAERYSPGGPSMPRIWLHDRADRIKAERRK